MSQVAREKERVMERLATAMIKIGTFSDDTPFHERPPRWFRQVYLKYAEAAYNELLLIDIERSTPCQK